MSTIETMYPILNYRAVERIDPLLRVIISDTPGEHTQSIYVALQLCIVLLGFCWLARLCRLPPLRSLAAALSFTVFCAVICSFDPLWLRWHWFPALIAALVILGRAPHVGSIFLFLPLAGLFVAAAGTLSIFGLIVAFLIVLGILAHKPDLHSTKRRGGFGAVLLICVVSILAALALLPEYSSVRYPGGARLTPIAANHFFPRPLLGQTIEPVSLLYSAYLSSLKVVLSVFLTISACIVLLLHLNRKQDPPTGMSDSGVRLISSLSLAVAFLAGSELLLPAWLAQYALFPAVLRVVPGFALSPMAWLVLPFGFTVIYLFASMKLSLRHQIVLLLVGGLMVLIGPVHEAPDHFKHSRETEEPLERLKQSPSSYLLGAIGPWVVVPRSFDSLRRLSRGDDFRASVRASAYQEEAHYALDGNVHTRWRTGRPQRPGDAFEMRFDEPLGLIRVVLSTKGSPSDFPRGIRVRGGLSEHSLETMLEQKDWLGPVRWTAEGYPYFGPQSEVVLDFPEQKEVSILRFEQLGSHPQFDWSISEIKLYSERE